MLDPSLPAIVLAMFGIDIMFHAYIAWRVTTIARMASGDGPEFRRFAARLSSRLVVNLVKMPAVFAEAFLKSAVKDLADDDEKISEAVETTED